MKFGEKPTVLITFSYLVLFIYRLWQWQLSTVGKYIIMDCHWLTNADSLWVLNFKPHRFQGIQLNQFRIQTTLLYGIGKIIVCKGMTVREYLGRFFLVVEQDTKVSC